MSEVSVIEWINDYTAIASVEGEIEPGERYRIETRERDDGMVETLKFSVKRALRPSDEYQDVHREKDTVVAKVNSVTDDGEKCVLEFMGRTKRRPSI